MNIIGRGWQYCVYDLDNGRVQKEYNSTVVGYLYILKDYLEYKKYDLWKIPFVYKNCKSDAKDSVENIQNSDVPSWMLAHAKYLGSGLAYEQDKVRPLRMVFKEGDDESNKAVIDSFVELTLQLFNEGIGDKGFNISNNFGLDTSGRVVLIDLGEVYSGDRLLQQIVNKSWASDYVLDGLPNTLRLYFIQKMNFAFEGLGGLKTKQTNQSKNDTSAPGQ